MGLVSPVGHSVDETWQALLAGKNGVDRITLFDTTNFTTKIAGEVKNFDPLKYFDRKEARRMDRFTQFAVAAAEEAIQDSGLELDKEDRDRIGVIVGSGIGGMLTFEDEHTKLVTKGPTRMSPFFIPMMIGNMAPGMVSIYSGAKGPNASIATACAAGTHAIGEAYEIVKYGKADAMITGGVESVITPSCVAGFNAMRALSTRNDAPQKASRPFDKDRDGFVIGEGCGILIIETLENAMSRDAHIYAEIGGYGMSGDGFHMSAPAPEGEGMARCMRAALKDASISYDAVEYINAHGTSTQLNDLYETQAIKRVFKDRATTIPVSSTKSMTGHLLGAAGGIEAVFTALTINDGIIPPTINFDNIDDDLDLDYVPNQCRRQPVEIAMSNSFGFGGTNATLILKKFHP